MNISVRICRAGARELHPWRRLAVHDAWTTLGTSGTHVGDHRDHVESEQGRCAIAGGAAQAV